MGYKNSQNQYQNQEISYCFFHDYPLFLSLGGSGNSLCHCCGNTRIQRIGNDIFLVQLVGGGEKLVRCGNEKVGKGGLLLLEMMGDRTVAEEGQDDGRQQRAGEDTGDFLKTTVAATAVNGWIVCDENLRERA